MDDTFTEEGGTPKTLDVASWMSLSFAVPRPIFWATTGANEQAFRLKPTAIMRVALTNLREVDICSPVSWGISHAYDINRIRASGGDRLYRTDVLCAKTQGSH